MLSLGRGDDDLEALLTHDIPSERLRAVRYRPLRVIGAGGMSVAFIALRHAPEGQCPVVLKAMRPSIMRRFGEKAKLAIRKEAVSLARLNEQVPPTPFVVRLVDVGDLVVEFAQKPLALPWLIVEYVHGGAEGTTLDERVHASVDLRGEAFDPTRAVRALDCIVSGLEAVHAAGVIHRDMKPDNVLCCGFGDDEMFKVADFGIARPEGIETTFGFPVGTPGYAAPETGGFDGGAVGPWSDVFGLAAVVFFLLTGEEYFPSPQPADASILIHRKERRSVLETAALSAELRARVEVCHALDRALARATAPNPAERTATAAALRAEILPLLKDDSRRLRGRRRETSAEALRPTKLGNWTWTTLHRPSSPMHLRDVGWDSDGRCLAASDGGLVFWDGTSWRQAPTSGLPDATGLRFVRRVAPGQWLVGGDRGTFATYATEGVRDVVRGDPSVCFWSFSGDLDDIAVFVGSALGETPALFVFVGGRWMRPFPFAECAAITGLVRIDDVRWLVVGRGIREKGYAAIFAPLDREIKRLAAPDIMNGAAGNADLGLAVSSNGCVLWIENDTVKIEEVSPGTNLHCGAIDPFGAAWVGGNGQAWLRPHRSPSADLYDGEQGPRWLEVWRDMSAASPIISMLAEPGSLLTVSSDGSVREGRTEFVERR